MLLSKSGFSWESGTVVQWVLMNLGFSHSVSSCWDKHWIERDRITRNENEMKNETEWDE